MSRQTRFWRAALTILLLALVAPAFAAKFVPAKPQEVGLSAERLDLQAKFKTLVYQSIVESREKK